MDALKLEKELVTAVAAELSSWRDELLRRAEQWYPEDVFIPVEKGQTYRTPDAAGAAMARHILRITARDLSERSIEIRQAEVMS